MCRSRLVLSVVGVAALLASSGAGGAGAQTVCDLVGSNYFRTLRAPGGDIVYVSRPVIRCQDGTRISADSAQIYSARNHSQFFGNVEFQDSATVLTTDRAHFFSREGRLQAWGRVVLEDQAEGSRITGDTLVYLRPIEARPTERITVTGRRPHATLYPAPEEPDTASPGGAPAVAAPEGDSASAPAVREDSVAGEERPALGIRRRRLRGEEREGRPEPGKADTAKAPPVDSLGRDADSGDAQADTLGAGADSLDTGAEQDSLDIEADSLDIEGADTLDVEAAASADEVEEGAPKGTVRIPYEVDADRIFLEGDRYFRATGNVELTRDSLEAYADSVEYDQRAGRIFLTESARLLAADYVLLGRIITLVIPGSEISEIVSRHEAKLTGAELRLAAPEIRLYLTDGQAQRLVAVHRVPETDSAAAASPAAEGPAVIPPRPRAVAGEFVLVADSVEAQTPGEVLDRVVAVGGARGESLARDSLNTPATPEVARRDWLEGDTVVTTFRPDTSSTDPDTGRSRYRVNQVVATGSARSLYRMEPSDTLASPDRLALHYVQGHMIAIRMEQGEVREMEVEGQTRGVYLEPRREITRISPEGDRSGDRSDGGGRP